MTPCDLLASLPGGLEWMVLFRLAPLRELAGDRALRRMFPIPETSDLDRVAFVVLTSEGPHLVEAPPLARADSLLHRYAGLLEGEDLSCADSVGLGTRGSHGPVSLVVRLRHGVGEAVARFTEEPSRRGWELLRAVGVEVEPGTGRTVRFTNDLRSHFEAARLGRYGRTGHCNDFFLQQGDLTGHVERGLERALGDRVRAGADRAYAALLRLAGGDIALTCVEASRRFRYGDLVPLGFVLHALRRPPADPALDRLGRALRDELAAKLLAIRRDSLWSYHSGGLVTATDSALVLLGFLDSETGTVERAALPSLEALERFGDGAGRYVPQLSRDPDGPPSPLAMPRTPDVEHWCRPDLGTSALIRGLRIAAGLPTARLPEVPRGALFFANPRLLDWVLTLGLTHAERTGPVGARLRDDLLAGLDARSSWDSPLSSALAILALHALGCRGRTLALCQLRLLDALQGDGAFPPGIPFYSTRRVAEESAHTLTLGQERHEVSLYEDGHGAIATALGYLALRVPVDPSRDDVAPRASRTGGGTVFDQVRAALEPCLER